MTAKWDRSHTAYKRVANRERYVLTRKATIARVLAAYHEHRDEEIIVRRARAEVKKEHQKRHTGKQPTNHAATVALRLHKQAKETRMIRDRVTEEDFRAYQRTMKKYRPTQLWRMASLGNIPLNIVRVIASEYQWLEEKYGKEPQ